MKKCTKIVSSTLAGALAVGMVPAMALADDGVELLVEKADAIAAGTVILKTGQEDGQSFAYGTADGYLLPVKVKPMDVTAEAEYEDVNKVIVMKLGNVTTGQKANPWVDGGSAIYWTDYTVCNVVDGKLVATDVYGGSKLNPTKLPVGKYAIGAYVDNASVNEVVTFSITGADATGLEFFDNSNGAKGAAGSKYNIEDEVITFKNAPYALNAGAGLGLKIGAEDVTDLFTIDTAYVKDANGMKVENALKYAGTYYVKATGSGKYDGVVEWVPVTISPINVADLVVTLGSVSSANAAANQAPAIAAINGVPGAGMLAVAGLPMTYAAPGTYSATIGVNPALKANLDAVEKALFDASIYGTTTASFTVATKVGELIDVYYGLNPIADMDIDYSDADAVAFSEANISVKYTALDGTVKTAANADEVITYAKVTDDGLKSCEATDLANPGDYKVTITLKATADQAFEVETYDVSVTKGELEDANISVTKDGAGVYNQTMTDVFDGTDLMEDISIVLRDSKGAVIPASDYTVEIKNTLDNKGKDVPVAKQVVTEIVNVGTYTVTVKSDQYDIKAADAVYTVTVTPETVYPWAADFAEDNNRVKGTVLYTGKAIDPVSKFIIWKDADGDGNKENVDTEFAVDASEYKVAITKFRAEGAKVDAVKVPTEVKEAGVYTITVTEVAGGNVIVKDDTLTLTVTTKPVFVDVAAGKFYTEAVHDLAAKGIMGGYGNGKFGVSDDAERQDVAVTALRLLDPTYRLKLNANDNNKGESNDNLSNLFEEVILPFADTDEDAYYAYAVWYCNKNGIMTGYADGSNEFGVGDAVTREQVAAILFRIDESGLYKAEDTLLKTSALDAYKDADEVSKYAVEAMEWAVENGIFGVNTAYLNPGEDITRAELAVVIDRYMELRKMA